MVYIVSKIYPYYIRLKILDVMTIIIMIIIMTKIDFFIMSKGLNYVNYKYFL